LWYIRTVPRKPSRPVATLWDLSWDGNRLRCAVYRSAKGGAFEVRLQSETALVFAEPFELGPRALARMDALRRSLERRGWREAGR
jgi:hypothetical protein